jgi:high-affinity iron transporter
MIAFLAAGMAAQSVVFLEQAGMISELATTAWDTSAILPESSWLGRILHTLAGYSDQPSEMQVIIYVAMLVAIFGLMRLTSPRRSAPTVAI